MPGEQGQQQQQHPLQALHFQVQAAIAQVQDQLQRYEQDRQQQHNQAGFVDLFEPLQQVRQYLIQSQQVLQQQQQRDQQQQQQQ